MELWKVLLVVFAAGGLATLKCYLDGTIPRIMRLNRELRERKRDA